MAAASMAGSLNWSVFSFPMGVAAYANTFVAQYQGAGHPERIGGVSWQAARVGIYATPLFLVVALLSPSIFRLFGHSEHLLWLEVSYFRVLAFASTAVVLSVNMVAFVPMIGIGMAISTLVGQQIGGANPRLAARATWTGWWIAMVYTTIFGGLYLLVPDLFVMPHALGGLCGFGLLWVLLGAP